MRRLTTEEYINRAKEIHDNFYDYSSVVYNNMHTKIKIICPIHGLFEQYPHVHLSGCGCPRCTGKHHKTTEDFIHEANQIHNNNFYDYTLTEYKGIFEKLNIICPIHGLFEQRASYHLQGS